MRRVLIAALPAFAAALAATPAMAQYDGPYLRWPGKVEPTDVAPQPPPPQPQPQPAAQPAAQPAPQPIAQRVAPAPIAAAPMPPRPPALEPQPQPQPAAAAQAFIAAPAPLPPAPVPPRPPAAPAIAVSGPPAPNYALQRPRPPQFMPGPRVAALHVTHAHPRLRLELATAGPLPKAAPADQMALAAKAARPAHDAHPTQTLAKATKTQPPTAQPPGQPPSMGQEAAQAAQHDGYLPPHVYSVARQYGLTPDPIPLPAQFFNDPPGQDMAAPPPPLPPRQVPGAQTVSSTAQANTPANRARAIAQDTAPPDGGD